MRRLLGEDAGLAGAKDIYDKTPLHYAAEHNRPEIAEILLAAGADVAALTGWGMTPLEWAANMGRVEVAEKLLGGKQADLEYRNYFGGAVGRAARPDGH